MDRQMRLQIEAVVFELMSWSEGHFRFTEGLSDDALRDASAPLGTESLLMEGRAASTSGRASRTACRTSP